MNRRKFLKLLGILPVAYAALKIPFVGPATNAERLDALSLQHWAQRTSDAEYYSIEGQTVFPVYGNNGGLASHAVRFRLLPNGRVEEERLNLWNGSMIVQSVDNATNTITLDALL